MKKTVFIFAAAVLSASLFAFDAEPTMKVAGKVSEYTKTDYTITEKFGDYYRSPRAKFVHSFDTTGKEISATELTSKDSVVDRIDYSYDEKGNLVQTVCTDADGKVGWKITTVYDADGNKTEESEFNASDALVNKTIWRTTAGKQTDESYYNADGALLSKIITQSDDAGRPIEIAHYGADGNLEEKAVYSYNDAGKLSEISFSNKAGNLTRKIVYRFDASYKITEEQTYNAENKLAVRVIYRYDAAGNIIRMTTYNVAEKFGTTVNELAGIAEYAYKNASAGSDPANAK